MKFKLLRKSKSISQVELAQNIGCDQTLVSKWENDVCIPSLFDLPKLAKILNCSIEDIVYCFCEDQNR